MLTDKQRAYADAVREAAKKMHAVPDQLIPEIWSVPGYPELTTGQLLAIAYRPAP